MIKENKMVLCIITMVIIVFNQSCKKGCTDPTAYNYVKGAKYDNASCLYCDSTPSVNFLNSNNVFDPNSSSTHYDQYVLELSPYSNQETYSGNGCQRLGLGVANGNSCTNTSYYTIFTNQTSNTMVVSGTLVANLITTTLSVPISSLAILPFANDTVYTGSTCTENNFNINITLQNASFQYH